ncbi:sugar transferase [Nocardia sp. NPDC050710]|uniref:sugar transferase n=1 Tax=Nocardia sp. NPDC050710 TaxID=3157220 RepID=UPI0033CE069C
MRRNRRVLASWLSRTLITVALLFLPAARRARFLTEWTAELDMMRQEGIPTLRPALRIALGAPEMGRVLRAADRRNATVADEPTIDDLYMDDLQPINPWSKRTFDFLFALAVLVTIAPTMFAIAIAIKMTSKGPVFYRSERIGLSGKPFHMLKFRSMRLDADVMVAELIESNDGDPIFSRMKDDPRVTPIGKVIRKHSLDELPQFISVLQGRMSIVGPRPHFQRDVDSYNRETRRRLLVKPGVTGLWQVSGRSDLSLEDAVRLDLSYVENWSMTLDLLLIAKTIGAVARAEGAY